MTTTTTPNTPALRCEGKYTNEEAQLILTLGETFAIQRHFGQEIGQGLHGMELVGGIIWALERRECLAAQDARLFSWADLESVSMGALNDYFKPDEIDVDGETPETESGKDSPLSE